MEVDVMGVKIVANVAGDPGPDAEAFELRFRLAHVAVKERSLSEITEFIAGVRVDRVPALVDLHRDENVITASGLDELVVFAGGFNDGLGD